MTSLPDLIPRQGSGQACAIPLFGSLSTHLCADTDSTLARTQPMQALARAWLLRQGAWQRSLALCEVLAQQPLPPAGAARLLLLQAQRHELAGELDAAEAILKTLRTRQDETADGALNADGRHLAHWLARSRGDTALARSCLNEGLQWARAAGDALRIGQLEVHQAFMDVVSDAKAAEPIWREVLVQQAAAPEQAASSWARTVLGSLEQLLGRPDLAVLAHSQAFEGLVETGQLVNAVICAGNSSAAFEDLQDQDASLEWAQRGLDLARGAGIRRPQGLAAFRLAECLRKLKRLDEAQAYLTDAIEWLLPFRDSRNFIVVLIEAGALANQRGELQQAQGYYEEVRSRAAERGYPDLLCFAEIGEADVSRQRGQLESAVREARQAVASAQTLRPTLRATAQMTLARCLLAAGEVAAAEACMRDALGANEAESPAPSDWWGELADCLAAQGAYAQAYEARGRAASAQNAERVRQAHWRAIGLQVRSQTARLQTEASAERQRAALLEASNQTLLQLGAVGQELTALLDEGQIYEAVHRHAAHLLGAEYFAVYLLEASGERLRRVFAAQGTQRFDVATIELDDPHAASARCLRQQRELLLNFDPDDPQTPWVPGAQRGRSGLFAPLRSGGRSLGVLSFQAIQANAFQERELQVCRSLCAYASIAIGNALAYQELERTQRSLAQQQRLAAIGTMVAGVAHEMNTPIGVALLAASTLTDSGAGIQSALAGPAVGRQQLKRFADAVVQAGSLVVGNLERAAQLIQDFKQLVLDPRTLRPIRFGLRQEVERLLQGHAARATAAGHRLEIAVAPDLELEVYQEPFAELMRHWADNALLHGLATATAGCLRVQARLRTGDIVELVLSDDGAGMAAEVAARAFEPFFSTRFSGSHSGLGLTVVHGVAVDLFGGTLTLTSAPGAGTRLTWIFARVLASTEP